MGKTIKRKTELEPRTLLDPVTGEEITAVTTLEEVPADQNFSKVWLKEFVQGMGAISNIKTKVAFWIIDHMDRQNRLFMTQREIAQKSGFALATITRTLTILQNEDFLHKLPHGYGYQVNPKIIYRGGHKKRMALCHIFEQTSAEEKAEDRRRKKSHLREAIAQLMKQLTKIEKEEEEERRKKEAEQPEEPQMQQAAAEPDDTKPHQHE